MQIGVISLHGHIKKSSLFESQQSWLKVNPFICENSKKRRWIFFEIILLQFFDDFVGNLRRIKNSKQFLTFARI